MHTLHFINGAFGVVVFFTSVLNIHAAVRLTALVGSVWLALLLITPRLHNLSFLARWRKPLGAILPLRKYLGLWAAAWFSAHAVLASWLYFGGLGELVAELQQRPAFVLEVVSLGILLLLMLTSNRWSYRHIRGWKHLQAAVWAVPVMALFGSFLTAQHFLGEAPLLLIATILFSLCIVVGGLTSLRGPRHPADWLRLSFLAAGGIITVVVLSL